MPEQRRADARRGWAGCRRDDDALGATRSSGTACARSATREPGRLRLVSRNGNEITARVSRSCARLNRALSTHRAILDGEVVAFDADGPARASRRCSGACT